MQRNSQPRAPQPRTFAELSPGLCQPGPEPGPRVGLQDSSGQRQARGPVLKTHGRTWRAGTLIVSPAAPDKGGRRGARAIRARRPGLPDGREENFSGSLK